MDWANIRIKKLTKARIDKHKKAGESYDNCINRLLDIVEKKPIKLEPILFYSREEIKKSTENESGEDKIIIENPRGARIELETSDKKKYFFESGKEFSVLPTSILKILSFKLKNIKMEIKTNYPRLRIMKINGRIKAKDWKIRIETFGSKKFEADRSKNYNEFYFEDHGNILTVDKRKIRSILFYAE
jgi:hypothetical protein